MTPRASRSVAAAAFLVLAGCGAEATTPAGPGGLPVERVTVSPSHLVLPRGDIAVLDVRLQGPGGRVVTGRPVAIVSDDPAIAIIDGAGRVRAVSTGTTTVRVTADGVSASAVVEVTAADLWLALSRFNGRDVPALDAADSVTWGGVREYHEVYVEGGTLRLAGATERRYELDVRYAEYSVSTTPEGGRVTALRGRWREFDRGLVQYDARGDLLMTSEYIWPLAHTATAGADGFRVRFRVPGANTHHDLMFHRGPGGDIRGMAR